VREGGRGFVVYCYIFEMRLCQQQRYYTNSPLPPSSSSNLQKSSTVSLLNLKAPGDFASLAKDLAPQFKKAASSKDVTSFVSELLARGAKDSVAVEDLNDLIKNLQSLALEKQRQADANRNKIGQKQKALAAKKREHKATSAKHKELFGDDFDGADPEMDQYYDMEDVSRGREGGREKGREGGDMLV